MYLLLKNDGSSLHLRNGETYLIGRKETNFILEDKTVSKKHAKISIQNKSVFIEDLKSSNRTFINGKALNPNVETQIKVGSQIRFGTQDSSFILKKDDLIITMSGLSKSDKELLKKLIGKMSGSIIANWSPVCTHVVVSEIVLTVKVLCALINKQSLVTINYFTARLNWIENNAPLPKINDFRPLLSDDKLQKSIVIDYDMDRTSLFKNKIFVFPNRESKKKMESIIVLAGGTSVSFDSDPLQKSNLLKKLVEYIFVIIPENTQSEHIEFNECVKYLMEHERRSIPMSEIAMAILVGNCDVECNPSFNKLAHVMSGERPKIQNDVIAFETQSQLSSKSSYDTDCSLQCIPSSLSPSSSEPMEVESGCKRQGEELVRSFKKNKFEDIDSWKGPPQKEVKKVQKKMDAFFKKPDRTLLSTSGRNSRSSSESLKESTDSVCSTSQLGKRKSEESIEKIPKKSKFTLSELISSSQSETFSPIEKPETPQPKLVDIPPEPSTSTQSDPINPFLQIETKTKKTADNPFLNFALKKKEPIKHQTDVQEITDALKKITHEEKSNDSKVQLQMKTNRKSLSTVQTSAVNELSKSSNTTKLSEIKKPVVKNLNETDENVNVFSSTRNDAGSFRVVSDLSHGTNCNRWLNKSSLSISKISTDDNEISEETKAYINNFKPASVVIVSASSLIVRRPHDTSMNISNSTANGKLPNFKKFKKVKPLHEQTEIIPTSCFITVVCGENASKRMRDLEESVLEVQEIQPVPKPTGSKSKFNFDM